MTAIFISHSSADNEAAAQMKAWLESQGHSSLFLDFDPAAGIKAGAGWEQTLYRKLRQCQAVIALVSPGWLASRWCFAELVQARERGKPVFWVQVKPADDGGAFGDVQKIDLTARPEEGLERLRIGLLDRGIDPLDAFDWDPARPPYPGLLSFEEADAAVFFGRGEALSKTLEALDSLRRQSGEVPRFVLLLGASGSGKSSLARAGILPRLRKRPAEWLPVVPMRPQIEPLDELAAALAAAFGTHGPARDWTGIRQSLRRAAEADPPDGRMLLDLTRELAAAARQPDATVLLTIDQAEELFSYTPAATAVRFLRLLRSGLELGERRLMVAATLRSDFLGEFQNHPVLQDLEFGHHLRYRVVTVDPMPLRSVPEIIRGPARLAGLELQDGLVEAMVHDTGTQDALPLLAFTLRRMYERAGASGRMTLADYEAVGRLDGAVRQEAERILDEARPEPDDIEALHAAFVPTLVRINPDGGFARRRARVDHLPRRILALMRRFVDARLLVSDRDAQGQETHEVAHEALLRTWPQLSEWLATDRDKLRLLESLQRAAAEWDQGRRDADLLAHRDGRLLDVEALLASPRFGLPAGSVEHAYLEACRGAQRAREDAARAEQERRLRDAERIAEEQTRAADAQRRAATNFRRFSAALGVLLVVAVFAALFATQQYHEAESANRRVTEVQQLARHTGDVDSRPQRSLLLSVRAAMLSGTDPLGTITALDGLRQQLAVSGGLPLAGPGEPVVKAAFSHDRRWLATGSAGGAVRLWDLGAEDPAAPVRDLEGHPGGVGALAFSRDGRWLLSAGVDGAVRRYRLDAGAPAADASLVPPGSLGPIRSMALSPDDRWLAFGTESGHLCIWPMSADGWSQTACDRWRDDAPVMQVAFSPRGRWLGTSCTGACKGFDAPVRLWDLSAGFPDTDPRKLVHRGPLTEPSLLAFAFNGDDTRLAVAYGYVAEVWDLTQDDPPAQALGPFPVAGGWIGSLALSPDQRWLAVGSYASGNVRLWNLADGHAGPIVLEGHSASVNTVAFSDDGRWLASGSADATARLWDLSRPTMPSTLLRGHDLSIGQLLVGPGPDPGWLVSWGGDPGARLWRIPDRLAEPRVLRSGAGPAITAMAVSAAGDWIATSGLGDGRLVLWSTRDARKPAHELPMPAGSHAVAFSPDGRWLAAKVQDKGVVLLWSLKDLARAPLTLPERDWGDLRTLAFSPDSRWLASGTWGQAGAPLLNLWDVSGDDPSLQPRHRCRPGSPVRELSFSADSRWLASAAHDTAARIWNLASPDPCAAPMLLPHADVVYHVGFSRDGRWAASASMDTQGRLWSLAAGQPPRLVREIAFKDRVMRAAFSPDNRWVAFASWDGTASLLGLQDAAASAPIALSGHVGRIVAASFSPDSRWLATAAEDRTVRLWPTSAPSAAPLVLRGHEAAVRHLDFLADGRRLASAADDGTVRLWRLELADLVKVACDTAGRLLTPQEAAQLMPGDAAPPPCAQPKKG